MNSLPHFNFNMPYALGRNTHSTIDFILVSKEFYFRNPNAPVAWSYVQALNDYLVDRGIISGKPVSSDHEQLVAMLTLLGNRWVMSSNN